MKVVISLAQAKEDSNGLANCILERLNASLASWQHEYTLSELMNLNGYGSISGSSSQSYGQ